MILSFSTFIFVTSSLHFLLLPLLNAMSAYMELFVYSALFIKLLLIFRVPVTWKHLKAVPTIVRTKLYKFFCLYMKQIQQTLYVVYGPQ